MLTTKLTITVAFIFIMLSFTLAACQPVSTASESESADQPSGQSANNGLAQVVPTEQTLQDAPTTSEQSGPENLPVPAVATGIADNAASGTAAAPAAQLSTSGSQVAAGSYTIVDTGQAICYSDQNAISCPQGGATFYGQDVYIAFGRALGYMNNTWMDVHGAGAQRSDPKGGAPADYPTGHGAQGDAIRIYNYVRLVRGGTSGDVFTGGEVVPEGSSPGGSGAGGSGEPAQGGPFVSLQLPQEAVDACVGLTDGASCTMEGPNGPVSGTCMTFPSEELACGPAGGPGGPPGGAPPP